VDLNQLLSFVLPDPEDCRRAAEELRLADPNATPEQTAEEALKQSRKWAVSIGAATGAFANPLTMLPAAVADATAMLKLEGKLAGTVAALLDPDSLNDPDTFRRDVMRAVFPGAVGQVLRRVGIQAGEQAAKSAVRKLTGRAATKEISERAAKALGVRLAEKAVAAKVVPVVGAAIGAAWNYAEVQAVGRRAIDYHLGREPAERRVAKKFTALVKTLPHSLRRRKSPAEPRPEGSRDVY
jgi:hypothetical protein